MSRAIRTALQGTGGLGSLQAAALRLGISNFTIHLESNGSQA